MAVSVPWTDSLTSIVAGNFIDISGTNSNTINVDLTECAAATIAAGDQLIFLAGGATGAESRGSVNDVATLFAGTASSTGLSASNGVMSVNLGTGLSMDASDINLNLNSAALSLTQSGLAVDTSWNIEVNSVGLALSNDVFNAAMKIGRASTAMFMDWSQAAYTSIYNSGTEEFRFVNEGTFHADADVKSYSTTVASDRKLKKNIRPLDQYGLVEVLKLRPVMYDWKEEKRGCNNIGFIAQEVQELIPEVVNESIMLNGKEGETKLGVEYNKMIAVLTKAIQEQQEQINELKQKIDGYTSGR
jgi:hypothetical protein